MLRVNKKLSQLTSITLIAAFAFAALLVVPPRKAEALGGNPSLGINISQVYGGAGCGTAGCSTYQNDFIELYNRSSTPISLNGWSVQYNSAAGTGTWQVTVLPNVTLNPGRYFLVAESFGANGVNPLPTPDATGSIAMSATAAKVAVLSSTTALTGGCPAAIGPPNIIDLIGYGATASCFETAVAPAPSTTTADIRGAGGNTETENNSTDFAASTPTPRNTASPANTPTATDGAVSGRVATDDGAPIAGAVVNLGGTQTRKTITDANGNYHFDNVETNGFYTVSPSRANFSFSPGERSFSQLGNNTEATFTGSQASEFVNPLDTPEYFVRQHYLDFLGREPDESGFNFWSDQIRSCGGEASCRERRTINVSAAYFLSIEFQQTGGLVDGLYRASYGRSPRYAEFLPDTAAVARDVVVGRANWAQLLEANKQAFVAAWVDRADFRAAYDGLPNSSYVDTLISRANGFNGDRNALVNGLGDGSLTRAAVLRQVVDNEGFTRSKRNETFVMMEYFGYLRRDPDAGGYQFWLDKLNQFDGNFERADMVKAFIDSGEYRARFAR